MYRAFSSNASDQSSFLDVESAIRGLTQDFCTAFNTGNYDQVAALFAADGVFMPPHRESSQEPKAIERVMREYGELGYQNLRFETTRVDHSGDIAIEMGNYTLKITSGSVNFDDRGKYLRTWRRLGAWMIVADAWSSSIPPHEAVLSNTRVA